MNSSSTTELSAAEEGARRAGVRWCEVGGTITPPSVVSATGAKPLSRNMSSVVAACTGDTSTVGAMRRSCNADRPRSASMLSSTVSSSLRMYDVTEPTRVCPWRRATSPTRYSSGCGTGVRLASCSPVRICADDQPASRPRRRLAAEKR